MWIVYLFMGWKSFQVINNLRFGLSAPLLCVVFEIKRLIKNLNNIFS